MTEKETIIKELEELIYLAEISDNTYRKNKLSKILEYVKNN